MFWKKNFHGHIKQCYSLIYVIYGIILYRRTPYFGLRSTTHSDALFEAASAIGTVGLTLGITPTLSSASHCILIFLMFFGRVGGLTLLLAISKHQVVANANLPQENITIG